MLTQREIDRMSRLTETDFRAIVTAVEGGIDWEFFTLLLEGYYSDRALKMLKEGWEDASDRYHDKAEKIKDYRLKLTKLNV